MNSFLFNVSGQAIIITKIEAFLRQTLINAWSSSQRIRSQKTLTSWCHIHSITWYEDILAYRLTMLLNGHSSESYNNAYLVCCTLPGLNNRMTRWSCRTCCVWKWKHWMMDFFFYFNWTPRKGLLLPGRGILHTPPSILPLSWWWLSIFASHLVARCGANWIS